MRDRVQVAGVEFDNVNEMEAVKKIHELMSYGEPFYVVTPNPEFVLEAQKNESFKTILNQAALTIPDGIGIIWAASFLSRPQSLLFSLFKLLVCPQSVKTVLKARVAGTDLMEKIVAESETTGWKIFLLGAREGIAEAAKNNLQKKYPRAVFAGCFAGDGNEQGDFKTVAAIQATQPDIVFVAYGAPKQEQWIHRNLCELPSVKMAMGVGGAFDFMSGKKQRAPRIIQAIGLEWLWRLLREPRRLPRIWRATISFIRLIHLEAKKSCHKSKKTIP
ncbi:WecB/TagA/CpsF family glycosyltransferase [Candidatus Peregrinibacteria bacterium]|nr:WecB/TagA/CpsF family glycosyltransferase [Candidatus Peregrinibacteria bacterium]